MRKTKKIITFFTIFSLILAIFLPFNGTGAAEKQTRVIVSFKGSLSNSQREQVIKGAGFRGSMDHFGQGSVMSVNKSVFNKLKKNNNVAYVEEDVKIYSLRRIGGPQIQQPIATTSWGFKELDAENAWTISTGKGLGVKVAVIDTGISMIHPDLKVAGGVNTISPNGKYNDDNGHGSHVAGIIASQENNFGTTGIAPNVSLYAVKALDKNGSGYLSGIIRGVEWSINNKMDIINLSMGFDTDSSILHDMIIKAKDAGITVVVAAGNEGPDTDSITYPAKYPEVIAVSAITSDKSIASWSSNGAEVDLAAPGENIISTYGSRGYAVESGTSMAAPFVAGVAALIKNTSIPSGYDTNSNGKWEPDEIMNKLGNSATDLGASGSDNYYGSGLVNAYNAVK